MVLLLEAAERRTTRLSNEDRNEGNGVFILQMKKMWDTVELLTVTDHSHAMQKKDRADRGQDMQTKEDLSENRHMHRKDEL